MRSIHFYASWFETKKATRIFRIDLTAGKDKFTVRKAKESTSGRTQRWLSKGKEKYIIAIF
jgi:hypothetical protein